MLKKYSTSPIDYTLPTCVEFRCVTLNNDAHIIFTQNNSINDSVNPYFKPDLTEAYKQIDILKQYIQINFPHIEII